MMRASDQSENIEVGKLEQVELDNSGNGDKDKKWRQILRTGLNH